MPAKPKRFKYYLLMEVRDEAGKVISRQSVGVGAIPQAAKRIFSLRVETTPYKRNFYPSRRWAQDVRCQSRSALSHFFSIY